MAKEGSSDCPQFTTPGRSSRDNLINTVYKLHRTRLRILEPYRLIILFLCKIQHSVIALILILITLIIQLLEETSTPVPPTGGIGALLSSTMMGKTTESRVDQNLYDSIKSRKTEELQRDCETMYTLLYKLIRKYQGLRRIIKDLHDKYDATRMYPIVPRYPILKKMIKSALRAPEFADICHEQTE
uniref:GED domain-containing protein n=1 Tax=Heterorhabditis bacteriophora TaxID=37862 RepID=A0A1I7X877_HETBA